jgi:peroxiredoxin
VKSRSPFAAELACGLNCWIPPRSSSPFASTMVVQVGDQLPDVVSLCAESDTPGARDSSWDMFFGMLPWQTLYGNAPDDAVRVRDVFAGKKGIIFGVPGAFTPGCSKVCG